MPHSEVENPEALRRLIDAILMLEADVELPVLLGHFVEEARSIVGARYGALGVLNASGTGLAQFLTAGLSEREEAMIGARPTGRGILGLLISQRETIRIPDLSAHPARAGFPEHHPMMTSFLGVPVRVRGDVYGNLYLADKEGPGEFTREDAAVAEALALAAGIAIENTRMYELHRTLGVLDDRERIGRELHDRVIQRLYAVGMSLQAALRLAELPAIVERMEKAIDELDATMTEIRGAIFELSDVAGVGGVRRGLLALAKEMATFLGVQPTVTFDGPVDSSITEDLANDVLAVAREGLANAGKHARASTFLVTLTVGDDVALVVADNGIGMASSHSSRGGLGLVSMRHRAVVRGGSLELEEVASGGTRIRWRVPL